MIHQLIIMNICLQCDMKFVDFENICVCHPGTAKKKKSKDLIQISIDGQHLLANIIFIMIFVYNACMFIFDVICYHDKRT